MGRCPFAFAVQVGVLVLVGLKVVRLFFVDRLSILVKKKKDSPEELDSSSHGDEEKQSVSEEPSD